VELPQITPKLVGQYLDQLRDQETSVSTRKQHLAALRHFFDAQVARHAMILNPALSVPSRALRGNRGQDARDHRGRRPPAPGRHHVDAGLKEQRFRRS
jgi:hypothetical protein